MTSGSPSSFAACAVAKVTLDAHSRWVRGMPVLAAAPSAAEMPGTTSNGTRAAQLLRLLSPSPEHERIPTLEAHDVSALERAQDDRRMDPGLVMPASARAPSDRDPLGLRRRERQDRRGHELVVGQHPRSRD